MLDHAEFYNERKIPALTMETINNYVENRWLPGSFVTAILENNLKQAYWNADDENLVAIPAIVYHMHNNVRSDCWGSPEAVRAWLNPEEKTE